MAKAKRKILISADIFEAFSDLSRKMQKDVNEYCEYLILRRIRNEAYDLLFELDEINETLTRHGFMPAKPGNYLEAVINDKEENPDGRTEKD